MAKQIVGRAVAPGAQNDIRIGRIGVAAVKSVQFPAQRRRPPHQCRLVLLGVPRPPIGRQQDIGQYRRGHPLVGHHQPALVLESVNMSGHALGQNADIGQDQHAHPLQTVAPHGLIVDNLRLQLGPLQHQMSITCPAAAPSKDLGGEAFQKRHVGRPIGHLQQRRPQGLHHRPHQLGQYFPGLRMGVAVGA